MIVRPYGDTTGDGMVQLSFTLPLPRDKKAEGAALQLAAKMGMDPAMVVHARQMGGGYTFFVVYGRVNHLVDVGKAASDFTGWFDFFALALAAVVLAAITTAAWRVRPDPEPAPEEPAQP